jgi:G:T-mismatch repair DNA endonuclease (very short patch repair protein)
LLRTSLRRSTGIRWKKTRNDLNGRPKVVLLRRP